MIGHADTPHALVDLYLLPLFTGIRWCPLCLRQVWLVKRRNTPPRPPYQGRKKPPAGQVPPLKAAVEKRRTLRGGLAGKWTPRYLEPTT